MIRVADSPEQADETAGYEYLVVYRNPKRQSGLFPSPRRGRVVKQTLESANRLVDWARTRGYDTTLRRRSVGEWEDVARV